MTTVIGGVAGGRDQVQVWETIKASKLAALAWTAMRVWLESCGSRRDRPSCGAQRPPFLHHNGAGVAGFATHGTPAYTWWGSFLHCFVVPNAGGIGVLVAVAEFAIGVALVAGLFTRIAALGSLALLFTYVMSGTASVCAFYALFAIVILTMWRTSSWIGIDGLIAGYRQRHLNLVARTPAPPGETGHDRDRCRPPGRLTVTGEKSASGPFPRPGPARARPATSGPRGLLSTVPLGFLGLTEQAS